MSGYDPAFFSDAIIPLPKLTASQNRNRAPVAGSLKSFELTYTHFSIVLHKKRRFAFFTACNIDGTQWRATAQKNEIFSFDKRIPAACQTGNELYELQKGIYVNDFDKGHIVKFQDPQWGTAAVAQKAGAETMNFANCVPQHHTLNRGAWKSIEDYIVKQFTNRTGEDGGKVTVFAGPALLSNDPWYIEKVQGHPFQIPVHFWKVVVYKNMSGRLSVVAFLLSQKAVLLKHSFVVEKKKGIRIAERAGTDFFLNFAKGEPYQISLSFLQKLTGYRFGLDKLHQPYTKEEPAEIILKRVEIPVKAGRAGTQNLGESSLPFMFEGMKL
jgi:endonuclease G